MNRRRPIGFYRDRKGKTKPITSKSSQSPRRHWPMGREHGSSPRTKYPTVDEIVELNRIILREIKMKKANTHQVLSRSLIESSIEAAKNDEGDIYDKAATLLTSLVKGHPFASGNRRTALAGALSFLRLNGETPKIVGDERVLMGIREDFYAKDEVKKWLMGSGVRPFRRK